MFNPLVDLNLLSDAELDQKIRDLSKKYFQTRNPQVQMQIASVLEMHREEFKARQAQQQTQQNDDSDLDNLININ